MCFPGGSAGKESACNIGDLGSIPWLWRSPGEGNSYPLQHSGLENSMCRPWGCKESDMTKQLPLHFTSYIHFSFGWKHSISTLSTFQLYSIALSTTVIMFYISSSNLIHLIAESLYIWPTSLQFSPVPCNHCYTLYFFELNFFRFHI